MKQYLPLFRNRNFVLLWLGGAVSNIGDFFNSVALVKVLSTDASRFGFLLALVLVAKMLPGVLLGPVAGVVADRISRRTIMIVSDVIRGFLVLGLVLTDSPAVIVALVFLAAAVSTFYNPASGALLPNLVTKDELVTANSLAFMTQRLAQLIGNGLGAAALSFLGAHNVFYIDAASFFICAAFTIGIVLPAAAKTVQSEPGTAEQAAPHSFKQDLLETVTFLRQSAPVRNLVLGFGIAAVGDAGLNVLLTTFFTLGLGLAVEHFGYLMAILGGASVLGALAIGALGNKVHWRHLISYGAVYVYVTVLGMLLSKSILSASLFMTLVGLGSGAINVGAQAAVGTLVPDHVRGRIFAAFGMLSSLIYVIFTMLAGVLSDHFGPTSTLVGYATFYLLTGIFAFFAFRNVQSQESSAPAVTAP